MEHIINLDDYKTIPERIKQYIIDNSNDFTRADMSRPREKYGVNSLLDTSIYNSHMERLGEFLIDTKIIAGHYTRVIDPQVIEIEGLKPLQKEDHTDRIFNIVGESNCLDSEKNKLKDYLIQFEKHISGPREGMLFFVYPISDDICCKHYSEAIGGEVLKFANDMFPEIYTFLSKIGTPIKIIAKVPFKDMGEHYKNHFIDNLIAVVLHKELDNCSDILEFNDEIGITVSLSTEDIIEIQVIK